jgi:hypothetical protein
MPNTKVTGDLIASSTITATNLADSSVTAAKLNSITTDHISEGTNLFYTDARVATYLSSNNYITSSAIANSANWDTAYSWGDHALVGYLTTETDPVFTASAASAITSTQITNWDTAYGWGNHATQSYATETYVNTSVANLVDSAPATLDTLNELSAALGDDPNFATTVSTSIGTKWTQDNTKISNWDTAFGWGNHASAGYLTSFTETDPTVPSHVKSITTTNISNWNTAYSWGNHAGLYLPLSGGTLNVNASSTITITSAGTNASFIHAGSGDELYLGGNGTWQMRFSSGNVLMDNGGYLQVNDSVRSSIFYDSNNTAFYVDPASTSNLNALNVGGNAVITAGNIGSQSVARANQLKWYGSGGTPQSANTFGLGILSNYYGGGQITNVPDSNYGSLYNFGGYDASSLSLQLYSTINHNSTSSTRSLYFRMGNNLGFQNDWRRVLDNSSDTQTSSGIIQSNSSIRGPIFYDSNDTGYYFDGSSTGDSIRVAGDIVAYYSDERLKDIKGNIQNPIDKVKQLNGFYYTPNETAQKLGYKKQEQVGLSAQEVEKVLPQIVRDAPIGQGYKTVDYSKLVPLLIEAIKELSNKVEELENKLNGTD